jgi:ribosomal protein S27E
VTRCPKCGHDKIHVGYKPPHDEDSSWYAHSQRGYPKGECLIVRCERCSYETHEPCVKEVPNG